MMMKQPKYPKIQTLYTRDPKTHKIVELPPAIPGTGNIVELSCPEFEYLQNNEWLWTEKVDGMNIRITFDGTSMVFGGRTDRAQLPAALVTKLNKLFGVEEWRRTFDYDDGGSVCLYGEGYGCGIQKAGKGYCPNDIDFVLFDVRVSDWWLQWKDVCQIAEVLALDVVPILGRGTILQMQTYLEQHDFNPCSRVARWCTPEGVDCIAAEGLVLRPAVDLHLRNGNPIRAKIKGKDFAEWAVAKRTLA